MRTAFNWLIVISLCFCFIMTVSAYAEERIVTSTKINQDLEQKTVGNEPATGDGFTKGAATGGSYKIANVTDYSGKETKAVLLSTGADNNSYGRYVGFNFKAKERAYLEMDIYVKDIKEPFTLWLRRTSGGVLTLGHLYNDKIRLYGGTTVDVPIKGEVSATDDAEAVPGEWYRVKFAFDLNSQTYSVYMKEAGSDVEIDSCPMVQNKSLDSACANGIDDLRVVSSSQSMDGSVAFDNVYAYIESDTPAISTVDYDDSTGSGIIAYNAQKVKIKLSKAITASSITTDNVYLTNADNDIISFESVEMNDSNKTIIGTLSAELPSNQQLTVVLGETVKTKSGIAIGETETYSVNVGLMPVDIGTVLFNEESGALTIEPIVVNETGDSQSLLFAVVVYNGDLMKDVKWIPHTTSEYESTPEVPTVNIQGGDNVEVYVFKSLANMNLFTSKIYSYSK